MDYDRSRPHSIHEPRVPLDGATRAFCARPSCRCSTCSGCSPSARRCGRRGTGAASGSTARPAAAINEFYARTLPDSARPHRGGAGRVGRRAHLSGPGRSIASRRGTSATSSAGSTSDGPSSSSRWRSGTSRCCARRSSAASAGGRGPIVRTGRPGRCARGTSGGGVAAAARRRLPCDMARPFLTVLTAPIPSTGAGCIAELRRRVAAARQAGRPAAEGLAVSRALRARPQRRRRAARDRRRLQLQPAAPERSRARRLRAGERGAAAGGELKRRGRDRLPRRRTGERAVRGRGRRHPAAAGNRSPDRGVRMGARLLPRRAAAAREERVVPVRRRPRLLETVGAAAHETSRSCTGRAATKHSASRSSRSSGRAGWSRAACARATASTRCSRPATSGSCSTSRRRRVPEHVRNPGAGARRGVVDGRADVGVGPAGDGRVAGTHAFRPARPRRI